MCPGNFTNSSVDYYLDLFIKYESGMLPFKGGIPEQPNKIIELFNIIDYINTEKRRQAEKGR
jgi:hypothetical protein